MTTTGVGQGLVALGGPRSVLVRPRRDSAGLEDLLQAVRRTGGRSRTTC